MENMFFESLSVAEATEVKMIKSNKEFLMKIVENLKDFYHVCTEVEDGTTSSVVRILPHPRWRNKDRFIANKDGVVFKTSTLCYRVVNNPNSIIKAFGEMYKTYEKFGTTADNSFLNADLLGEVHFVIPINSDNQKNAIRDIITILDHERFKRIF